MSSQITALLNRLNTGCRSIDHSENEVSFKDNKHTNKSSKALSLATYNTLRNASHCDEIHAELGCALGHSYIESLLCSSSTSYTNGDDDGDDNVENAAAIERGDNIIYTLCCGEENSSSSGSSGSGKHQTSTMGRENYASVAYAFFNHLHSFFLGTFNDDDSNTNNYSSKRREVKTFVYNQWQKWCIRCEELVLPSLDGEHISSSSNGGGIHVLSACLKYYSYSCDSNNNNNNGGASKVYESLVHHSSRKFLIRTFTTHAFSRANDGSSDDTIGGLADAVSPLFHSCVSKARRKGMNNHVTEIHAERKLIVHELLRGCSTLLIATQHGGEKQDLRVCIATMIEYLTTSLVSFLKQSIHAAFTNDDQVITDMFELNYEWLRGICDLMMCSLVETKEDIGDGITTAISTSMKDITSEILPQMTTTYAAVASSYEMAPIYSSLVKCMNALNPQRKQLVSMASSAVAMRLGSLTLSLSDETEVKLLLALILSMFNCLGESTATGNDRGNLITGGILSSLGCIFHCRPSCAEVASQLYKLGESILQSHSQKDEQKHGSAEGVVHLMDIIANSMGSQDFQPLVDIISSSISDTGGSFSPFNNWQRRPLSSSDQSSGLLLGLSLLHMSITSPETVNPESSLQFLRSFLQCYPRLASRVIPSIIAVTKTCLITTQSSMSTVLLEFLADPAIVSDPHGASTSWTFLSSLVAEGVPTSVRSTVIRLLPRMCSSNKRLFRRVMGVIGKAITVQ